MDERLKDSRTRDGAGAVALDASGLSKSFGGVRALAGMEMTVTEGLITGLIGPNGAGKSTLFDILSGVLRPDEGRVRLWGEDVTGRAPRHLAARGLTRSFQLSRELTRLSVLENLMIAARGQSGERLAGLFLNPARVAREDRAVFARAIEVMQTVGLADQADALAGALSGGQKKLLDLGRALMAECRIVLLDEPGAGVNATLMNRIVAIIEEMNRARGVTFLIVEHDMDLIARICDPVVVMVEGRRLAEGPFETLRRDPRVLEAYLGGASA